MQTSYPTLFSPTEIGGVRLRNRLAHASIVTRMVKEGRLTPSLLHYLSSRAHGGAGLVITEPLAMIQTNRDPQRLRVYDNQEFEGLQRLAQAIEGADSRLLGQVQDPGRGRHKIGRNAAAIGASALPDDLSWTVPHALTPAEISDLHEQWARGCQRLQRAGFSGVEISAGHGHLFHQFLSPAANRREDDYGGSLEGRTRFLRELMDAIRTACDRPFMIGLKLPGDDGVPGGIGLEQAGQIAQNLAATGQVDYWTFVWGAHANSLHRHLPTAHGPRHPYLDGIRDLRALAPEVATGAIGYLTDPNEAEHALTNGTADLVFLGRPLITDPAWGEKAQAGREADIRYCVSCNTCWRTIIEGKRLECDNNPRVGEPDELEPPQASSQPGKQVVIVGGGVAGMEAAWVAAARGHKVNLFSQSDEPGGQARIHAELPGGENLSSIYDYQLLAGKKYGVHYHWGTRATVDTVAALNPDHVLLATGSSMDCPSFIPQEYAEAGFMPDLRELVGQLLGKSVKEDGRIVIYDRDHTEMTYNATEWLAERFEAVTLVTPRERIASDVSLINRQIAYQRLSDANVDIVTSHEPCGLDELEDGLLRIENVFNGETAVIADVVAITYANARVPDDELLVPLEQLGIHVQAVGDCRVPGSVLEATRSGYEAALAL